MPRPISPLESNNITPEYIRWMITSCREKYLKQVGEGVSKEAALADSRYGVDLAVHTVLTSIVAGKCSDPKGCCAEVLQTPFTEELRIKAMVTNITTAEKKAAPPPAPKKAETLEEAAIKAVKAKLKSEGVELPPDAQFTVIALDPPCDCPNCAPN